MATVVLLGGAGALGGVLLGVVVALARARARWVVALAVAQLAAWLVHVFANVRGCVQPQCGENAYPLSLIFGVANFLTLVAAGIVTHALITARRAGSTAELPS